MAQRRVRATILCAPSDALGVQGLLMPRPSLDMLISHELRAPRRPTVGQRLGDAPCPSLYREDLDLSVYAELDEKGVGAARFGPTFNGSLQALLDGSSGQLTACLSARALSGLTSDKALQALWFASGAVSVKPLISKAEVEPVAMLAYKAQLAASLVRWLSLHQRSSVFFEGEVAVAPFLVSRHQNLETAFIETEALKRRAEKEHSGAFWPFAVSAEGDRWTLKAADERSLVRLEFLRAGTVEQAEMQLREWYESRKPPAAVEPPSEGLARPRGRSSQKHGAVVTGLSLVSAAFVFATAALVGNLKSPRAVPTPLGVPEPSQKQTLPASDGVPDVEPENSEGRQGEPDQFVSVPDVSKEKIDAEAESDASPSKPKRARRTRRRHPRPRLDSAPDKPSPPPDRGAAPQGPQGGLMLRKSDESIPPTAVDFKFLDRGGAALRGDRIAPIRRRLEACIASGKCPMDGGRLEVTVVENLVSRANPHLIIRGLKCASQRPSSCFRSPR